MLNLVYSKALSSLATSKESLSVAQTSLLEKIQSKSRFEQLMAVLPEGWEEMYTINFYDEVETVTRAFQNSKVYKGHRTKKERIIRSIIVSEGHDAVPGRYDEYLKRDYEYPIEEDKWKIDQDLTEYVLPSFHIDHRLIWTMKEREVNLDNNETVENTEFKYTINVYIPKPEVLIDVENIKLNKLV